MEAVQNRLPPIKAVVLQFLLPADQGRMDGAGGRCAYGNGGTPPTDPVLVTMGSFGWVKVRGELIKLAADSGSAPSPVRTWTHYSGREITLRILPVESRVAPNDSAESRQQVRLVVRDAWDREVSAANLIQDCRP